MIRCVLNAVFTVASRAGHSAHLHQDRVVLYGGREGNLFETLSLPRLLHDLPWDATYAEAAAPAIQRRPSSDTNVAAEWRFGGCEDLSGSDTHSAQANRGGGASCSFGNGGRARSVGSGVDNLGIGEGSQRSRSGVLGRVHNSQDVGSILAMVGLWLSFC